MPRGTRALSKVAGTEGASRPFTMMIRAERVASVCWCGRRYVEVPTLAVWRGNTATCGLSICRAPDGREPADGELIELDGTSRVKLMTGKAIPEPSYTESDGQIHEKRVLRRAGRLPAVKVVARRNRVQEMYGQQMHVLDIALALDVPTYTVKNDLSWLVRHGKIRRHRNQPRQRRTGT